MDKTCQKCGASLQENDFLCPNCGAIYGEPVYEAPKQEEQPTPAPQKKPKLPPAIVAGIALLIVIACVLIWDPFRPAETTPTTAPTASTFIPPTTSALPTPPPTTLPPTIPTTVPTTAPPPATMPPTVPETTLADNQRQLDWIMDAKVVRPDATLVSNTTVTLKGLITIEEEASDILLLDIVFLPTFPYMAFGIEEYPILSEPGRLGPYYISSSYFYDRTEKEPAYLIFALDPEAECAIFILPEDPAQYLVCSTAADVNAEEVIAHFQAFLDSRKPN